MVPSSTQENLEVEPPRNLFFGVEDRKLGGPAGLTDKYLHTEQRRRQQLAQRVIDSAIQVADAIRTMRKFDRTGNADQVLDHLNASLEDLDKHVHNLTAEVEKSVDRYGDELDALRTRDEADETAAYAALNAPAATAPPTAAAGPNAAAAQPAPQAPAAAASPNPAAVDLPQAPAGATIHIHAPSPADVAQVKRNLERALDRRVAYSVGP